MCIRDSLMLVPGFVMNKEDLDRPLLEKFDAVLNARACNEYVQVNKEAVDYIRVHMPCLADANNMTSALERMTHLGERMFGKLDMLNAYSQLPLPVELQPYTAFKVNNFVYVHERVPFGLSVASHIFTHYLAIHCEVAKGRFLSSLVP